MKKIIKLSLVVMTMLPLTTFAQKLTLSGQGGYAGPQGTAFQDANGEAMAKFGLGFDFDLLYHLEQFENKLSVGLTYNTSILFGVSTSDDIGIGLFGHTLYGAKGHYRFFDGKVSPYASLSLGLAQLSLPEIKSGDVVIAEAEHSSSFGIRPEVGLDLGGFLISVGYFVPMKYKFEGATEKISAGSLQISIGGRFNLWDPNR